MRWVLIIMMGTLFAGLAWGIENGNSYSWVRQPTGGSSSDFCSGGVCSGNLTVAPFNVSAYYGWFDFLCLTSDTCISSWPAGSSGSGTDNDTVYLWINDNVSAIDQRLMDNNTELAAYIVATVGGNVSDVTTWISNNITDTLTTVATWDTNNNSEMNVSWTNYVQQMVTDNASDDLTWDNNNYTALLDSIDKNVTMLQVAMIGNLSSAELNNSINDRWSVNYNVSWEDLLSSTLLNNTITDRYGNVYNVSYETVAENAYINGTINDRYGANYNVSYEALADATTVATWDTNNVSMLQLADMNNLSSVELNNTINYQYGSNYNVSYEETGQNAYLNGTIESRRNLTETYPSPFLIQNACIFYSNGSAEMSYGNMSIGAYTYTTQGILVPSSYPAFMAAADPDYGLYFQAGVERGYNFTDANGQTTWMFNALKANISITTANGSVGTCGLSTSMEWTCS